MTLSTYYNTEVDWLERRTILFVKAGSHAYGTSTPASDLDLRGIAVAPVPYRDGFLHRFEQAQWNTPNDTVVYDLRKFFNLAADCNPNVLELLYTVDEDVIFLSPEGEMLRKERDLFLSQKALHTYRGYAISQLKRIRTHRRWLLDPPKAKPTRADFNLPEHTLIPADHLAEANAAVQKKMDSWEFDLSGLDDATRIEMLERVHGTLAEMGVLADERWRLAGHAIGLGDDLLAVMGRERQYTAAKHEWDRYQNWIKTRNPDRATLEAKHTYDTKHAMHLYRLLKMCGEILESGQLIVRRPDAQELLAIRNGAMSYDDLEAWAEAEDKRLLELAKTSKLPKNPNRNRLDELCCALTLTVDIHELLQDL